MGDGLGMRAAWWGAGVGKAAGTHGGSSRWASLSMLGRGTYPAVSKTLPTSDAKRVGYCELRNHNSEFHELLPNAFRNSSKFAHLVETVKDFCSLIVNSERLMYRYNDFFHYNSYLLMGEPATRRTNRNSAESWENKRLLCNELRKEG